MAANFIPSSVNWKDRFPHCGVQAEVAYAECEKISASGELTPEAVVEKARVKRNPLHKIIFDKSDEEAAEEYRLSRARSMLRAFEVVYEEKGVSTAPRRAFEIVEKKKRGDRTGDTATVYKTTAEAMSDPQARAAIVRQALNDLISWRSRYMGLKELEVVFNSIAVVETELTS